MFWSGMFAKPEVLDTMVTGRKFEQAFRLFDFMN